MSWLDLADGPWCSPERDNFGAHLLWDWGERDFVWCTSPRSRRSINARSSQLRTDPLAARTAISVFLQHGPERADRAGWMMHIDNIAPVPVEANVYEAGERRATVVTAKATFRISTGDLETQSPIPLFAVDETTELGLLPADGHPRFDAGFEVILLGHAHAPAGRAVTRSTASLSIGSVCRQLAITGDRVWRKTVMGWRATDAIPFASMPLTFERAFGGSCRAYLDAESTIEITHPLNPLGRGFDPTPIAVGLGEALRLPTGLPLVRYERWLPNVEHPGRRVSDAADDPPPAGWSTVPRELTLHDVRSSGDRISASVAITRRAHPDWLIARPAAGTPVRMSGMHPGGSVSFRLPSLRIFVDAQSLSAELCPQLLMLLPEEDRYYLVFRARVPTNLKVARIRLADGGWAPELTPVGASL